MKSGNLEGIQSTAGIRRKDPVIGVYSVTCLVTGKCYVGWSKDVRARLTWHKSHLRGGKHSRLHMQQDFTLYGEASFTFAIISVHDGEDDSRLQEAILISEAFKAGKSYNAVVPVDVSEAFKTREENHRRKQEAQRVREEEENRRQKEEKLKLYKRRLINSWMSSCLLLSRAWQDDAGFLRLIDQFLESAPFSEEEFGLRVMGDEAFVSDLRDPDAPGCSLAIAKQVRDYIEAYIARFEHDDKDYLPILESSERLIDMQKEIWRKWLPQERVAA